MTKPEPLNARSEFVKEHLRQFEEQHVKPGRERVQANPDSLTQEAAKLFTEAKAHFKSRAWECPGNKEALYLFARERLDDLVRDQEITERVLSSWEARGSQYHLAKLILYPLNPWPKYTHI